MLGRAGLMLNWVTETKMKRRTWVIAAGVLAIAGIGAGLAMADRHGGGRHGFGRGGMHGMGQDGMGMGDVNMRGRWFAGPLTKDEFDGRARERFARLDKNSDGVIDAAEIEAGLAARMGQRGQMVERFARQRLARIDADRDGKATKAEFLDRVRKGFAEMDLDNDGKITDADLPPMMRGRGVLSGAEGGGGMGRGRMGGMMGGGMMGDGMGMGRGPFAGLLAGADANKDGAITLDEVLAVAEKHFARLDRNNDGAIDKADGDAMRKEMTDYRVKRFIHHFGADKDGKVTRDQFMKKSAERFAMMDLDNNGTISRDERPGGWGMFGRGHRGMGSHDGMGSGQGGGGGQGGDGGRPGRGGPDGGPQVAPKRP